MARAMVRFSANERIYAMTDSDIDPNIIQPPILFNNKKERSPEGIPTHNLIRMPPKIFNGHRHITSIGRPTHRPDLHIRPTAQYQAQNSQHSINSNYLATYSTHPTSRALRPLAGEEKQKGLGARVSARQLP
jgi:hypothetical protein